MNNVCNISLNRKLKFYLTILTLYYQLFTVDTAFRKSWVQNAFKRNTNETTFPHRVHNSCSNVFLFLSKNFLFAHLICRRVHIVPDLSSPVDFLFPKLKTEFIGEGSRFSTVDSIQETVTEKHRHSRNRCLTGHRKTGGLCKKLHIT